MGKSWSNLVQIFIPILVNGTKLFYAKLASSLLKKVVGVRFGSQAAFIVAAPAKETAKPVNDDDDDDDIDFFGEDTEEKKKTAKVREATKASTKKNESGKSFVLLDVKP
ncbi:1-aminocyclopropane-1-carboxylate oxidase [Capsicum annuum]|nr:1-aminocyclopropane-1-carboxylate oxidase [Capsicum annuum]